MRHEVRDVVEYQAARRWHLLRGYRFHDDLRQQSKFFVKEYSRARIEYQPT